MARHRGLTDGEVLASREKFGGNQIQEAAGTTFWMKFRGNLGDPIIKILLLALAINVIFSIAGQVEWLETIGIGAAIILATSISTWSEHSNEMAFRKTQAEASRILAKVYRNGTVQEISVDDIVKGDLILLQSGDKVPADGFILEGSLTLDQSVMNGEGEEAVKVPLPTGVAPDYGDTFNHYTLFRNTVVTAGEGIMEAGQVGNASLMGKLSADLGEYGLESPLKGKLRRLARSLAFIGYTSGILVFIAVMFRNIFIQNGFDPELIHAYLRDFPALGQDVLSAIILGVVIIVIAVPEGLPLMIALVLSQNMKKMLRANVLVRKLVGIETSGSLNILFSDKTGTLTKGQLRVVTALGGDLSVYESYRGMPKGLRPLLQAAIIHNTDAVIGCQPDGTVQIVGGNATEKAVMAFIDPASPAASIVSRIPFSSARKFSATTVAKPHHQTFIKGAPEKILPACTHYFDGGGVRRPFTALDSLNQEIDGLAGRKIRVIVLAVSEGPVTEDLIPAACTLIGVLGIRDDVRPEAVTAISEVQEAGIQVVMITGDRLETAEAIAREAGILNGPSDLTLTSLALNGMSDEEVRDALPNIRLVARALPTDKSRLVRLSQDLGLVVGMTGDGVNDAPALKLADVGFAMGSGTEAAKEAGDIVVLDDNFQSIANAVLYGRTVYRSIQKFITFQLTLNAGALATNFLAPLAGIESPLTIIQMMWVNLVMDSLGALAFGAEPALKKFMKERPRYRFESIVTREMAASVLFSSIGLTGMGMWLLTSPVALSWLRGETAVLYTAYFAFFILYSVVNGFNARSEGKNIFENIRLNPFFLRVMGVIALIQVGMIFAGGSLLRTVPLGMAELALVFLFSLIALPLGLAAKMLFPKN